MANPTKELLHNCLDTTSTVNGTHCQTNSANVYALWSCQSQALEKSRRVMLIIFKDTGLLNTTAYVQFRKDKMQYLVAVPAELANLSIIVTAVTSSSYTQHPAYFI